MPALNRDEFMEAFDNLPPHIQAEISGRVIDISKRLKRAEIIDIDGELFTADDMAAIEEGRRDAAAGCVTPDSEMDWDNIGQ